MTFPSSFKEEYFLRLIIKWYKSSKQVLLFFSSLRMRECSEWYFILCDVFSVSGELHFIEPTLKVYLVDKTMSPIVIFNVCSYKVHKHTRLSLLIFLKAAFPRLYIQEHTKIEYKLFFIFTRGKFYMFFNTSVRFFSRIVFWCNCKKSIRMKNYVFPSFKNLKSKIKKVLFFILLTFVCLHSNLLSLLKGMHDNFLSFFLFILFVVLLCKRGGLKLKWKVSVFHNLYIYAIRKMWCLK